MSHESSKHSAPMYVDDPNQLHRVLIDPLVLSDAIVAQGERARARERRRTYIKTVVRCASHSGSPEDCCLLRNDGYYRVGDDLFSVDEREQTIVCAPSDCANAIAFVEEKRRKRSHLLQKFVDDDEARLLQRYADQQCSPLVIDVYDRSLSASASEQQREQEDSNSNNDLDSDCDDAMQQSNGDWQRDAQRLRIRYCATSYVCYILQSLVRPSKSYVGITNDRFARLRRHNGEIVGGAKATRAARPWRMVAFIDGFGADKSAALRFEWSMHHPRVRRLSKPWHGADGRLNCARQLLESEVWRNAPLRLWAVSNNEPDMCASDVCVPLNLQQSVASVDLIFATPAAIALASTVEATET